jgi:hypothetical protein
METALITWVTGQEGAAPWDSAFTEGLSMRVPQVIAYLLDGE